MAGRWSARLTCCTVLALIGLAASSVAADAAAPTPLSTSPSAPASAHSRQAQQQRQALPQALSPTSYPTITFDEVPLEEFVTNQYEDDGVIFTSTVPASEDAANPTSPVLSGYPRFEGAIEGEFVNPSTGAPQTVSSFTLDVGYIDNRDSVVVEAFDSSGNQVQSVLAESYGINTLTLTYAGMASFSVHEIAEEPAGFAIDNLSIDPTADPTPVTSVPSMGDSYSSGEGLHPRPGYQLRLRHRHGRRPLLRKHEPPVYFRHPPVVGWAQLRHDDADEHRAGPVSTPADVLRKHLPPPRSGLPGADRGCSTRPSRSSSPAAARRPRTSGRSRRPPSPNIPILH